MSYPLTPSTDHQDRGLTKLLEQFKNRPYFEAILGVFLRQVQKVEDCAWEVITYSDIDNAFGYTLDIIGRIVGRPRFGLGDDDYRQGIKAEIRIKRSKGRAEDLIQITRLSIPNGMAFTYDEPQTHTVLIELIEVATFNVYQVLFSGLIRAKLGGVKLYLLYTTSPVEETFTFSEDDTAPDDEDMGWGDDLDPDMGGYWSDELES